MQITNWREAEDRAAAYMRAALGFKNVRLTAGGADGGVDVVSNEGVAQVKFEARQIGRPALQTFVGATVRTNQLRLFFTGTAYSSAALEYADHMGMALFTYALDGKVQPVNGSARTVVAVARQNASAKVHGEGTSSREPIPTAAHAKPDLGEAQNVAVGAAIVAIPLLVGAFYAARMGGTAWIGAAILAAIGLGVACFGVATLRECWSPTTPSSDDDPEADEQSPLETRPGELAPSSDNKYLPFGPGRIVRRGDPEWDEEAFQDRMAARRTNGGPYRRKRGPDAN